MNIKTYLKMLALVFLPAMVLIVLFAIILAQFELSDLITVVITVGYAVVLAPIIINWVKFLVDKDIL